MIFPLHLSKVLRLPRKVMPGHPKCCTCHAKSSQQTWRFDAPKRNLSQEISDHAGHRFWKCYKSLTFCSFLTRCTIPCACHAKRHLNVQKWSEPWCFLTFWLRDVLRATTACTFSTAQLPKVLRSWCVLCILTSKCASHHNGVHFFDIPTSKSAPNPSVFCTFDLEMCFAPQRRAIFHLSAGHLAPHPPL